MSNRFNMFNDDEPETTQIKIQINITGNKKIKKQYHKNNYQQNNNYHNNNYHHNYNRKQQSHNYPKNNKQVNRFNNNNRFQNNNYHKQNNNYHKQNNNYQRQNNNYHKQNNNYKQNNYKKKNKKAYLQKHPQYNHYENDFLNTEWTIHIHNTSETDWTMESYKKVYVIKKISDFWTFFNNFTDLQKFNFYVMRGDIKPTYEDKNNTNGYSYSYIIPGRKVNDTFIHCLAEMMCEKLVDIKNYNEVCGVSLVPKPNGISIFKIWMRNKTNVLKLKIVDDNLINGRYQDHRLY